MQVSKRGDDEMTHGRKRDTNPLSWVGKIWWSSIIMFSWVKEMVFSRVGLKETKKKIEKKKRKGEKKAC